MSIREYFDQFLDDFGFYYIIQEEAYRQIEDETFDLQGWANDRGIDLTITQNVAAKRFLSLLYGNGIWKALKLSISTPCYHKS